MIFRITSGAVLLIALIATASALFRVVTAPDRIKQRMDIANETCTKNGGQWVTENGHPICKQR